MSVDLSGEITAVATAALAVFAILTTVYAIRAFRKQSQEVSDQASMLQVQSEQLAEERKVSAEQIRVLGLQAEELRQAARDREHEAQDRRRAQAVQVYMWETRDPQTAKVAAHVRNTSQQPVYEVVYLWESEPGSGHPDGMTERATPLMPGEEDSFSSGGLSSISLSSPFNVFFGFVTFRDRAGVWWQTWPNGRLEELPGNPFIYVAGGNLPFEEMPPDVGE